MPQLAVITIHGRPFSVTIVLATVTQMFICFSVSVQNTTCPIPSPDPAQNNLATLEFQALAHLELIQSWEKWDVYIPSLERVISLQTTVFCSRVSIYLFVDHLGLFLQASLTDALTVRNTRTPNIRALSTIRWKVLQRLISGKWTYLRDAMKKCLGFRKLWKLSWHLPPKHHWQDLCASNNELAPSRCRRDPSKISM